MNADKGQLYRRHNADEIYCSAARPVVAQTDRCQAADFTAAMEEGADLPRHRE